MTATAGTLYLAGGPPNGGMASLGGYAITRVTQASGTLADVAGFGPQAGGFTPDGSPALTTRFFNPCALAVDRHQNLVLADGDGVDNEGEEGSSIVGNARVRVIAARDGTWYGQQMQAGRIYTIAGTGTRGLAGDRGPAVHARLRHPGAVAVDPYGNVVIADVGNARIRVVAEQSGTFYGVPMRAGDIYTVAGTGPVPLDPGFPQGSPVAAGAPALGTVLHLEDGNGNSPGFSAALALDQRGDIVFADAASTGLLLLAARTGQAFGRPVIAGHLYPLAGASADAGPGTSAGTSTDAQAVDSVAVDPAGNVLAARVGRAPIVVAASTGTWYGQRMTVGHAYPLPVAPGAPGHHVAQLAVDPAGNVFEAFGVRLYTDLWSDPVWALARHSGILAGQRVRAGSFTQIAGLPATTAATTGPMGLPVISSGSGPGPRDGDLAGLPAAWAGRFVPATLANHRVVITAPGTGTWFGRPMLAGHAYAIAGDGTFWEGQHIDGALATAVPLPSSVDMTPVVDRAGNVLLADPFGGKVWAVAARSGVFYGRPMTAGHIYTIVVGPDVHHEPGVRFGACHDWMTPIITDAAGNLVIGCGQSGLVVLATRSGPDYGRAMRPGRLYPLAVSQQGLGIYTTALAVDGFGNLVVDNQPTGRRGVIEIVAGSTQVMYRRQMRAGSVYPVARIVIGAMSADPQGNLLVVTGSRWTGIDVIAGRSGTYYGMAMTAGRTYHLAGSGRIGYTGDGGPAARARFLSLQDIAFWPGHGVLVYDGGRVRLIYPPLEQSARRASITTGPIARSTSRA